eukprot:CAMPEP_0167761916 /NCGR_PEP_ID=MMETSP0110_2-20121227/12449_1 /TAXON_ID=629695 /ORGANISM="Gymnochlora sp., Strain CCMP2014" /LENGTH=239 /DNA_ID=CAMNT_0007648675 /DNA_START=77 /DNA_END=796 /DNA_ORIENTATION=-
MMIIIIVVLIIILVLVGLFLSSKSGSRISLRSRGSTVFLVGPMNTGKTKLFYKLILEKGKKIPETVTSQSPNEGKFSVASEEKKSSTQLKIVDLPGHDSQWPSAFQRIGEARAFIFVIDSTDKDLTNAGQKLFDLMTDPLVKKRKVPFLIACNKSDSTSAMSAEDIEDELTIDLRDRSELKCTIEDTEGNSVLKSLTTPENEDDPFQFALSPCPVKFAQVSVKDDSIDEVIKFCTKFCS